MDKSKTTVSQKVERQCAIRKSSLVFITKSIYKSIDVRGVTKNIIPNNHCCIFKIKKLLAPILRIRKLRR